MSKHIDAIEYAAIDKENGFRHLRAGAPHGNAHGLYPAWDGAGIMHARRAVRS